ncbi:putative FBD-associated F-box protein At1g61330 [Vicia villosa]|uniref:putative FBD-associated F-box protein At1g61330 n=1 Tax=Vicia villosa TaxID=3911 RepID=UPI00273B010C|nr:putative FBD-associated F-box protein At1g61330 [Vicia villosa]
MDISENQSHSLVNLPEDIIQNIFTFLPIKNAIVTSSTMASKYKRSWRYNRRFLFNIELYFMYTKQDLANIVDHVFNSHQGAEIKTFQLHINPDGIEVLLKKWLQICTQKDLEDLDLHIYRSNFTIEFSVFNALHKLKTLKLVRCVIQLPEVPNGLKFLNTISLRSLHITEDVFNVLITHCKMLEVVDLVDCSTIKKVNLIVRESKYFKKLRIARCEDLEEIEIDSPTLHSFFYQGIFLTIQIAQGMQLYEASLIFKPSKNYIQSTKLEALVNDLSRVSVLTITPLLIEGMTARIRDGVFREAQYCFVNLKELQIFMNGTIFCNPYDIFSFLKNCPSLMKLFIDLDGYQFDFGMYWEMHQKNLLENCNHKFTQLKFAVIRNFKFLPSELELVKLILQRGTILERLVFVPPKKRTRSLFKREDAPKYEEIFCSWRLSTSTRVMLHDKYVENTSPNPTHSKFWLDAY